MRKGSKNYSLESLTSDPDIMRPSAPVSLHNDVLAELGQLELQSKTKMKEIFGRERLKRDGTPAKVGPGAGSACGGTLSAGGCCCHALGPQLAQCPEACHCA